MTTIVGHGPRYGVIDYRMTYDNVERISLLKEGWVLYGDPVIHGNPDGFRGATICQAMVKYGYFDEEEK